MYHGALSNNNTFIQCRLQFLQQIALDNTNNPPTQNQQISKSAVYTIKYSTQGGVSWQIQHLALPHDVFATQSHPSCCISSYSTHNSALVYIVDDNVGILLRATHY